MINVFGLLGEAGIWYFITSVNEIPKIKRKDKIKVFQKGIMYVDADSKIILELYDIEGTTFRPRNIKGTCLKDEVYEKMLCNTYLNALDHQEVINGGKASDFHNWVFKTHRISKIK